MENFLTTRTYFSFSTKVSFPYDYKQIHCTFCKFYCNISPHWSSATLIWCYLLLPDWEKTVLIFSVPCICGYTSIFYKYSAFVGNHMDVEAKMHGMQNIKIKIVLYIGRKLFCYSDIQRCVAFNDRQTDRRSHE